MRSFDFTAACPDLYYFTGVYRYYRDAYPRAYPVYKPLVMLFPAGDMQTGLRELNTAAVNSIVLTAESMLLLSNIYVNFENRYDPGMIYSRHLIDHYPENPKFLAIYVRNLLLLKSYDEADKLLESVSEDSANRYILAQMSIFKGILREKKYLDNRTARQCYEEGLQYIAPFGDYGNEYAAYSYFGLSRISEANGEKKEAEMYRKEALRLAAFKKIDFND
jgi:tetratricopeptide (TPR) repeat protein